MLKPINGYEGLYSVSSDGRVWSHYTRRWLRPGVRSDGYAIVILYRDGAQSNGVIHRLVAEAWVERTGREELEVNHIDGNKLHNRAANLEWVTRKQNIAHAIATGLLMPNPTAAKKLGIAARKITVEDARIIREEHAHGTRQQALARRTRAGMGPRERAGAGEAYRRVQARDEDKRARGDHDRPG